MKRPSTAMLLIAAWAGMVLAPGSPFGMFGPASAAEGTPDDWLTRMDNAVREHDYDGIFSYYGGDDIATVRIIHKVVDGVEHKRIVHLNGAPREIISTGRQITHIVRPNDNLLALERSMPTGPYARVFMGHFAELGKHYDMRLGGSGRIADRNARRLDIRPKDGHRFGHRLWIDIETGLLLRSELHDEHGENLEIFQFATLKIGAGIDDSELTPDAATDAVTKPIVSANQNFEGRDAPLPWRAHWIPSGFRMTNADVRRPPSDAREVNVMMFSDGLAAFSIFIEAMQVGEEDSSGAENANGQAAEVADADHGAAASAVGGVMSRSGATVALTHVVPGADDEEFVVIVVGEIPVATARRIAQGVYHER